MSDSTRARPGYFGSGGRGLFGWYHPARGVQRDCAVVLCYPLGHETTGVHRAFRHWAGNLAAAGFSTLRFDYQGTGDSAGDYGGSGPEAQWDESIDDAIDFLRRTSGVKRIALAGMRLGGTFALSAARRRPDVDLLILWAADPTGRAYLREGRAFTRLMTPVAAAVPEGREQIGGMVLSPDVVNRLERLDPFAAGQDFGRDILVIPRDPTSNDSAFVTRLCAMGGAVTRELADGYASVMVDAHQAIVPTAVIERSVAWLQERSASIGDTPSAGLGSPVTSLNLPAAAPSASAPVPATGIMETPVSFGVNESLFGILSRPVAEPRRRTGVVLANAGAVYRTGPNGLYVSAAREWASLGYTVLRMDIGGLGDSSAPPGGEENHTYPTHAVADIADAVQALRARGAERVVVAGLCSGAHASFHAGLELAGLAGILVVNPIVFHWKPSDPLDVAAWVNYNSVRYYSASLRRSDSWRRLVTGQVNVVNVARVAAVRIREIVKAKASAALRLVRGAAGDRENVGAELDRIRRTGTDVLLLFSQGDPGEDFLRLNYAGAVKRLVNQPGFAMQSLENADHTFTMLETRQRALRALTAHLVTRHP